MMAQEERLPAWIGAVSPCTQTPLGAIVLIALVVLVLKIFTPLETLAESSEVLLTVFAIINLALIWFKLKRVPPPENASAVPIVIPIAGTVFCVALRLGAALAGG